VPHRILDLRISDIIDSIQRILEYVEGITFDQFAKDRKTIDAVVKNFIVIRKCAYWIWVFPKKNILILIILSRSIISSLK